MPLACSAWSVEGLDVDGDGVVSRAEQQELADQDLAGLADYQFYTFAGPQGSTDNLAMTAGPEGATRDYENGISVLRFAVEPSCIRVVLPPGCPCLTPPR